MELLKISFHNNEVVFSYYSSNKNLNNFINSNNMYNGELLYSFSYVNKNINKIKEIINSYFFNKYSGKFVFSDEKMFIQLSGIIQNMNFPIDLKIKGNFAVSYEAYKKILKIKNLNSVYCYFMPENYVHTFALKNVSVYFSFKGKFSRRFIELNDLFNMKNMYYKRNIVLNENIFSDFELFVSINRHLKIIHIYDYSLQVIERLVDFDPLNAFTILIHQNGGNIDKLNQDFKKLKELNKKYKKKTGEIKIIFSDDFVKNNIFKQLTYSNLKVCSAIIIYLAFVLLISNSYNDYVTWFNSNSIMNSLSTSETTYEIVVDDIDVEPISPVEDEEEDVNPYANIPTNLETLLGINNDTVGWLSVNNTKINYPVTQSSDNSYYLNRDFYGRRTANGWVFMDYRNDIVNLSKNTILYGHALLSGYMFGDLRKTIKSSWYKEEENLYITFNTLNKEMKWEVISIYKTPYTTDYLKVNFFDDDDFLEFVDLILDRSVYNFGVKVNKDDYILTLSTCSGNDNGRLVLHAKLVK